MKGEGFAIIPIKHEHQLAYACNVLNLGNGRIISVHADSARQIVKHPAFKGDVQVGTDCTAAGTAVQGGAVVIIYAARMVWPGSVALVVSTSFAGVQAVANWLSSLEYKPPRLRKTIARFVLSVVMCVVLQVIDFSSVTSMYGSVHCASQVVRRVPSRFVAETPMANGNPEHN
jgi:N-dimethylarginine dimethylaminohydrolase